MTGCIICISLLDANSVRYMAASKHKGAEKIKARNVTYKELKINGQKPNFPLLGAQLPENKRLIIELVCSRGMDLSSKATPINSGNSRITVRAVSIHLPVIFDRMELFSIGYSFLLLKCVKTDLVY
jgi:hypothetical protein